MFHVEHLGRNGQLRRRWNAGAGAGGRDGNRQPRPKEPAEQKWIAGRDLNSEGADARRKQGCGG